MNVKKIACFLAVSLCLSIGSGVKAKSGFTPERIGGANRYDTSVAVSKNGWSATSDYAVIASGEEFSDALSAAPLAKQYNAPILLVSKDKLDNQSNNTNNITVELSRLKVKKVFLIGGEGAVSLNVENTIKNKGIEVERLSGKDRYDTSIQIAKKVGVDKGIVITTGEDFPDALSMAPIAASKGMPIILMSKDGIPASDKEYVTNNVPKTYVIGPKDLVKDEDLKDFKDVQRISGDNEYERNVNALETFSKELDYDTVYIASRNGFADALSGSALAALTSSPVILVGEDCKTTFQNYIKDRVDSIGQVNILGGEGVVRNSLIESILPVNKDQGINSGLAKASMNAQNITSMQSDNTIGVTVGAKDLPAEGQKVADTIIPVVNNAKLGMDIKMNGNKEKTITNVQEDITMNIAGMNVQTTLWVATDISGSQPKIKEIVKVPAALATYLPPQFVGKQYMVMDPVAMTSQNGAPSVEFNGLTTFGKNFQPQFQKFMENYVEHWNPGFTFINYKGLTKISTKEGIKFAQTYQLKLNDITFKAMMNYTANDFVKNKEISTFVKQFMITCADLSAGADKDVQKQQIEKMFNDMNSNPEAAMKQIKFFMDNIKDLKVIGDKGIDVTYYVADGYIIGEDGIVDLQLDLHKFVDVMSKLSNSPANKTPEEIKGLINLGFTYNTKNYDINKEVKIEVPELTKENSFDYMELIKAQVNMTPKQVPVK